MEWHGEAWFVCSGIGLDGVPPTPLVRRSFISTMLVGHIAPRNLWRCICASHRAYLAHIADDALSSTAQHSTAQHSKSHCYLDQSKQQINTRSEIRSKHSRRACRRGSKPLVINIGLSCGIYVGKKSEKGQPVRSVLSIVVPSKQASISDIPPFSPLKQKKGAADIQVRALLSLPPYFLSSIILSFPFSLISTNNQRQGGSMERPLLRCVPPPRPPSPPTPAPHSPPSCAAQAPTAPRPPRRARAHT